MKKVLILAATVAAALEQHPADPVGFERPRPRAETPSYQQRREAVWMTEPARSLLVTAIPARPRPRGYLPTLAASRVRAERPFGAGRRCVPCPSRRPSRRDQMQAQNPLESFKPEPAREF